MITITNHGISFNFLNKMKWKSKHKERPKHKDIRIRKKFLLLPKKINGHYKWLETAEWTEEFLVSLSKLSATWKPKFWNDEGIKGK